MSGSFHDEEVTLGVEAGHGQFDACQREAGRDAGDFVGGVDALHGQDAGVGAGQVGGEVDEVGQVGEGAGDDAVRRLGA
jgi:hypothetical protein